MTPNMMQTRAQRLLTLYAQAEEMLLKRIGGRLRDVMSATDAPLWYRIKMTQIQAVRSEMESAIAELDKASRDVRDALYDAAFELGQTEALKEFNEVLPQQGADGIFTGLSIGQPSARSQALTALIDDADGRFSELHRRILRDSQDVYSDVLAESLPFATEGIETYQQAITRALNGFADRGITGFVDKAGRRWGMSEYAEMAVRTGLANAQIAGYTQEALKYGYDLVIVSDHADTCPLCGRWERKVLSLTGIDASDPECDGMLADARAAGLFHPNCGHRITAYIPGQTDKGLSIGHNRENDAEGYRNRQLQRYYERQVRKWKRRQAAALTPEEERYAQAHVRQFQKKLRTLTASNNLRRKYEREGGQVLLSKQAKALPPLRFNSKGGIIRSANDLAWLESGYEKAVEKGDISALTGFETYVETAKQLDKKIVGIQTSDGHLVEGYTTHFIDRVIGSYTQKREPVDINDIYKALLHGEILDFRESETNGKSCSYCTKSVCSVSFNISKHILIQVTPFKGVKK